MLTACLTSGITSRMGAILLCLILRNWIGFVEHKHKFSLLVSILTISLALYSCAYKFSLIKYNFANYLICII